jgi:hypothetical protein
MANIYSDGVYRDMTPEEEAQYYGNTHDVVEEQPSALTEMITTISNATTISQVREAAKIFLEKTEVS